MDPYASPPFLGPLHAVLHIDWKQLTTLPSSTMSYTVRFPALPLQARLAGFSFGERFVAFADATPASWTATVTLAGVQIVSSSAGAANPPGALPVGQLPAPFYFGQPIGNERLELSVAVTGSALPATVTSQSLAPPFNLGALAGLSLTIATDDRGPFTTTFTAAPVSLTGLLQSIQQSTFVDPTVGVDAGNHLVLTSKTLGPTAAVSILGGTALGALGLKMGTTACAGTTAATLTGKADLAVVAASGGLNGLTLSFGTDDRGPFTVTFGTPASAQDVMTAIRTATLTDPVVSLNANSQLVITSGDTGASAFVQISGSAAPVLGLTQGFVYGTNGGALPARVTGTVALATAVYTALSGQQLTLSTDSRSAFTVTFPSTLASPRDVVTAIADVDPIARLSTSTNFLVLTSGSGSATPVMTIVDGTALAALGLTPGTGATPGTVTGTVNMVTTTALYGTSGTLGGLGFTFQTDDRGPFTVTFGTGAAAPTNATDVLAAIAAASNTDPVVSVDGNNHLVVQTRSTGSTASLTISGSAATTLGLTTPTYPIHGANAPGVNGATAGHVDAHLFYFVERL